MSPVPDGAGMLPGLVGWLATYALHSTLLLTVSALVAPRLRSEVWRESLLRTALVGALLTATVQVSLGFTPVVGRWTLGQTLTPPPSVATEAHDESLVRGESPLPDPASQEGTVPAVASTRADAGTGLLGGGNSPPRAEGGAGRDPASTPILLVRLLVAAWVLGAVGLLGRVAWRQVQVFQALRGRRSIREGPLAEMLAELRRNAGVWNPVRLSASAVCPTPIALGWSEICVPERFVVDLEPDQQRGALAHELAHLARRDPVWELFTSILEAAFFFQPLNRLARRRLREVAEHLSDDWAVRQTGAPLSLARCLTDIASWVGAGPEPLPTGTMAMAEGGSPLLRRVRRLAERDESEPVATRLRLAGAAGLLAIMATAAPAISLGVAPAVAGEATAETLGLADPIMGDAARDPPVNRAGAVPSDSAVLPDTVVVHPDPSTPLAERWQWALERGVPGGYWIAWSVDVAGWVVSDGRTVTSNSPGAPDTPGTWSLHELVPGADVQMPAVAFLFGFPREADQSGHVDWIRLRPADAPLDLAGRSLIWLGPASTPESLSQLRRIYGSVQAPELKQEIAAALTLHQEQDEVVQAVLDLLDAEDRPGIRAEAVQWLPRTQLGTKEIVRTLLTIAFEDPANQVRLEAVDAIANLESEEARHALMRIVENHPEMEARSEAAQALARRIR